MCMPCAVHPSVRPSVCPSVRIPVRTYVHTHVHPASLSLPASIPLSILEAAYFASLSTYGCVYPPVYQSTRTFRPPTHKYLRNISNFVPDLQQSTVVGGHFGTAADRPLSANFGRRRRPPDGRRRLTARPVQSKEGGTLVYRRLF